MTSNKLATALCALLVAFAAPSLAQNQATTFSHGPTLPFWTVGFDSTGSAQTGMLASGAGYSLNFNFFPNWDGGIRRLTLGVPFYITLPEAGTFVYRAGLTLGTLNNLLSFGAVVDLVSTGGEQGSGALLGNFGKENVAFVFGVGFNIGGGNPPDPVAQKALAEAGYAPSNQRPPNYIGW